MRNLTYFIIILLITNNNILLCQTEVPLTNNMEIESNSTIKLTPGNYSFMDFEENGVIIINNKENIVIDGSGVNVEGKDYAGYMMMIVNSKNITIKNFQSARKYFYGARIENSDNITIQNCNFSENKIDSSGWISIWTDADQALGGGVIMVDCHNSRVTNSIMKHQNDGVALYHCNKITVDSNDFAWNTSYGIRMYFSDTCSIRYNIANNINRPYTDPSDCAAILMLVSNINLVEYNDFRFSGDGVFLGQFKYSDIRNGNIFRYNDCSGSPHNAIEATFADGNHFDHNKCNESQYGLWLGYSFNTFVTDNEINYNQVAGVSIEWGYDNYISSNTFIGNPIGIQLFERGTVSSDYPDNYSHNYDILGNKFRENTRAITSENTEHIIVKDNEFIRNWNDMDFVNNSNQSNDTLRDNTFESPVMYFIENKSPKNIYAIWNTYTPDDDENIDCKMYDKKDDASLGEITWLPKNLWYPTVFDSTAPRELTEPPNEWSVYTEECLWHGLSIPTTVEYDSLDRKVGKASLKMTTGNGWYVWANFRDVGKKIPVWNLSQNTNMSFWVKGADTNNGGFQFTRIRLGNKCGGYYNYTSNANSILNTRMNEWKHYIIPLKGNSTWVRTGEGFGDISLSEISYIELYADTYGVGFTIWFDGLTFDTPFPVEEESEPSGYAPLIYPNPIIDSGIIKFKVEKTEYITLKVSDIFGNEVARLVDEIREPGSYEVEFEPKDKSSGIYFYTLLAGNISVTNKIVVVR